MESTACKSIAVSGTLYTSFSLKNVEVESVEYASVYTSFEPFAFCEIVSASGVLFTELFDSEMASGVEVGMAGDDTDTFVGNKTVAACVVFGLKVNVLPLGSDELHLTATFVPRFSNSMSVASFVSMEVGLFRLVFN